MGGGPWSALAHLCLPPPWALSHVLGCEGRKRGGRGRLHPEMASWCGGAPSYCPFFSRGGLCSRLSMPGLSWDICSASGSSWALPEHSSQPGKSTSDTTSPAFPQLSTHQGQPPGGIPAGKLECNHLLGKTDTGTEKGHYER